MIGLRLSEVVLRTTIYDRLCDFYSLLLAQPRTVEMTPPPSDDPDANLIELSSLNFSSRDEMRKLMATDEFKSNPNGFPLDPERLVASRRSGGDLSEMIWER